VPPRGGAVEARERGGHHPVEGRARALLGVWGASGRDVVSLVEGRRSPGDRRLGLRPRAAARGVGDGLAAAEGHRCGS